MRSRIGIYGSHSFSPHNYYLGHCSHDPCTGTHRVRLAYSAVPTKRVSHQGLMEQVVLYRTCIMRGITQSRDTNERRE